MRNGVPTVLSTVSPASADGSIQAMNITVPTTPFNMLLSYLLLTRMVYSALCLRLSVRLCPSVCVCVCVCVCMCVLPPSLPPFLPLFCLSYHLLKSRYIRRARGEIIAVQVCSLPLSLFLSLSLSTSSSLLYSRRYPSCRGFSLKTRRGTVRTRCILLYVALSLSDVHVQHRF